MKNDTAGKNTTQLERLRHQNKELRTKLREAEEALQAIREGAVDAVVVSSPQGAKIFTLTGEEKVYRHLVETMNEAGLTTTLEGKILFCNERFSSMLRKPMKEIIGHSLEKFIQPADHKNSMTLLADAQLMPVRRRLIFVAADGSLVPARVSANLFKEEDSFNICLVAMDLTELEASEEIIRQINENREALRESEEKYRNLVKFAPAAIYEMDLNGTRFLSVNEVMCNILGYTREELLSKKPSDLLDEESGQRFKERIIKKLAGEKTDEAIEYRVRRKDGIWIYAAVYVSTISLAKDKSPTVAVIAYDITERKLVEEEIQKLLVIVRNERDKLSALINSINDEIWFTDADKKLTLVNPAVYREFGLRGGVPLEVEKIAGSFEVYRPDGTPRPVEEAPPLRALRGEVLKDQEEIVRTPATGELRNRQVSAAPVRDSGGAIVGSVSVVRDITELKKREHELNRLNRILKALSDSSQAMMRTENEADYLQEVCRVIERDCGYTLIWIGFAENDEGKSVMPVAYAGFDEGYIEALKITWSDTERGRGPTGTAIRTGKFRMCKNMLTDPAFEPWRKEALERGYASSVALPIKVNDLAIGAITIYSKEPDPFSEDEIDLLSELAVDLSHGITSFRLRKERAITEEKLRKTAEELERSNRDLEQFAYAASHDLREPLRAVSSFTQLLGSRYKDRLDKDGQDLISFTVDGAKRMDDLLVGLLEYARIQTQSKPPVQVSAHKALDSAIANLRKSIDETGAVITSDELPIVKADVRQLSQLFQNLIANAIKFRSERKPEIHIGFKNESARIRFSVRDNGIGIDPQFRENIFVIFKRLHPRDKYPGYGIGLSICKRIAERHGGRIWVESQPGEGATFYFTIPE